MTKQFLFKDKTLGIHVCSKKCEHEYLKNLATGTMQHGIVLRYLDNKIAAFGTRNKIGWGSSAVGAILLVGGFVVRDVNLFLAGVIVASISALATRHFEDKMKKLVIQRKRLAI